MNKAELLKEVAAVQKIMDDSKDTGGALREILMRLYLTGVRRGAVEGYQHGVADGKREASKDRSSAVARRVHSDATRDVSRTGTGG